MKLVTTTCDLTAYFEDRSIAAPLESMNKTGFKHLDMSFYSVIYKDSPWISSGDKWKKEVEDCLKAADQFIMIFVKLTHLTESILRKVKREMH